MTSHQVTLPRRQAGKSPSHQLIAKKNKIIFLVGPTAIGKSEVALLLAKKINAEIISCDSMQIYRGMDIISSKPFPALRKKIRHHLIDSVAPTREYNVSRYYRDALKKARDILGADKLPLFVGGTGLYMSILIDGIFKLKKQDKSIRSRLYQQAEKFGNSVLYERLKEIDPLAARKIHPHDTKRLVRALEVFENTGRPISELQKERKGLAAQYPVRIFALDMPRDKLYQRINSRVEEMFGQGLADEVKGLLRVRLSKTAACAIGIKELKGYFDGDYSLEEARRLIKKNTRNYAKRQLTWFRKDKRIEWVKVREKETAAAVADRIFKKLRKA
ncbi:MAG: tRNA (adenosine(37)-N6)-dimethylallyltransferase MiaA [Candidatus Omnitrophica bacterium]|nr:tRNA (adenosine(37)-N6)-dimethylallyltransferase MiaA [Candidatus Omnitrophota bacterium]